MMTVMMMTTVMGLENLLPVLCASIFLLLFLVFVLGVSPQWVGLWPEIFRDRSSGSVIDLRLGSICLMVNLD